MTRFGEPYPSRRHVVTGLGASALTPSLARPAVAQAAPFQIYMITWRGWEDASQGFKDYLDRRGIRTELIVRDAGRDRSAIAGFVEEAKALQPDLVYTWGTTTALATFGQEGAVDPAVNITDIPSVFTIVSDPRGSGLVRDYQHPRPNLTGTLYIAPLETQLRTIEAYGPFDVLGAVFNPQENNARTTVEAIEAQAKREAFIFVPQPVLLNADAEPDPASIPDMVASVKEQGAEWLYIPPDSFLNINRDALTAAALAQGLPSFASAENFIRHSQGLLGLVSRYYNVGQFTGFVAEKILMEGAAPDSIPVESLDRFSLLVNMDTARALNFFPPMSMLTIAEFTEA